MKLNKYVFLYEKEARSPSENLSVNKIITDKIKNGTYDLVGRVYKHTNGVILGNLESRRDINESFCNENGFEVINRTSGGSAVIVTPELTLCYSVFANLERTNLKKDLNYLYKMLTIPLAKKLGKFFVVEGNYYIRRKENGKNIPFAGHAMRISGNIWHFDGIVNKTKFDMNLLENILKLRRIFNYNGNYYILMDGNTYSLKGKEVDINLSNLIAVKDEYEDLSKTIGLEEVRCSEEKFSDYFYDILKALFPSIKRNGKLDFNHTKVMSYQKEIKTRREGKRIGLGHCFIDYLEPEKPII